MGVMTHGFLLCADETHLAGCHVQLCYCTSTCKIRLARKLPSVLINS